MFTRQYLQNVFRRFAHNVFHCKREHDAVYLSVVISVLSLNRAAISWLVYTSFVVVRKWSGYLAS